MLQLLRLSQNAFVLNGPCVAENYWNLFGISNHPFSPYETPLQVQIHRLISMPGISSARGSCWFGWMKACWVLDFMLGVKWEIWGGNDEFMR